MAGLLSGIPRDPARIDPVLQKIAVAWKRNPDLRLGQLLFALAGQHDVFMIEDDALVASRRYDELVNR